MLYLLIFLLLARKTVTLEKKKVKIGVCFLLSFLAIGAALALYEGADIALMISGILIFNGVVSSYHSKENYAFFILALFFLSRIYYFSTLISQVVLLGFLSGAYVFLKPNKRYGDRVELRRDFIQILCGIVLICVLVIFSQVYVKLFLVLLVLAASTVGNYGVRNKNGWISNKLYALERKNAVLGQGAMWLAMGTMAATSFLSGNQLVAVLSAILIGDAAATIAGMLYKVPIPYNRSKSVVGTAAYFISTAVVSFPFIGYAAILTALVAALVESAPKQIDDNFDTAIVLIVLIKLLGYAKLV